MLKLELPEVETYRRDLEREVLGHKIKAVDVRTLEVTPGIKAKKVFGDAIVGTKIVAVERVALTLVLRLDNEQVVAITLGEQGRLLRGATKDKPGAEVVNVITFTQGGDLRVIDPEKTTTIHVVHNEQLSEVLPEFSELGLDLHASPISWVDFGQVVRASSAPLKLMLTDPARFVGIGDVYSNEILFDSGLRHDRPPEQLSTQEIRRLYRSVAQIVHDSVKYGGTSLPDRPFADLNGKEGEYAEYLAVWGRVNELSPRSRVPIQKTSFKNQVVYFCSTQV